MTPHIISVICGVIGGAFGCWAWMELEQYRHHPDHNRRESDTLPDLSYLEPPEGEA